MGVRGKGYTDSITFSMLHQSVLKFTHAPIRNFNIPRGAPEHLHFLTQAYRCSGQMPPRPPPSRKKCFVHCEFEKQTSVYFPEFTWCWSRSRFHTLYLQTHMHVLKETLYKPDNYKYIISNISPLGLPVYLTLKIWREKQTFSKSTTIFAGLYSYRTWKWPQNVQNSSRTTSRRRVVSLQSIEHFDAISLIDKGAECGKLLSICF